MFGRVHFLLIIALGPYFQFGQERSLLKFISLDVKWLSEVGKMCVVVVEAMHRRALSDWLYYAWKKGCDVEWPPPFDDERDFHRRI